MTEVIRKIDEMLEKSRSMINSDFDKGYVLLNEALELASKNNYLKGIAWGTLRKGSYLLRKEDKTLALSYYYKAIKEMEAIGDKKGLCRSYYSIATAFAIMTQYDHALDYFLKALDYAQSFDQDYYSKILNNLSNVYLELGECSEAIILAEKAVELMIKEKDERLFMPYTSLGLVYIKKGAYKEALSYANKALKYLELKNESNYRARAHIIIGGAYKGLNNYDEALIVFHDALRLLDKESDQHIKPVIHKEIASLYLLKKNYRDALKHLEIGLLEALNQNNLLEEAEILLKTAELHGILENYKKSYESSKRAMMIKDGYYSEQLKVRYQTFFLK